MRHFALLAASLAAVSACAPRKAYVDDANLKGVEETYQWFNYGTPVQNGLTAENRRDQSFARCGLEQGQLKPFVADAGLIPAGWYDESVYRSYARPVGPEGCGANETKDPNSAMCWREYALQFYPSSPSLQQNRYRVPHTSPIMRFIPKESPPAEGQTCRFDGSTALIWVAGVSNAGQGLTWGTTDGVLLANILAWNRNINFPAEVPGNDAAGHGKLRETPSYVQLVQNDNSPSDGIYGKHNEVAIKTMIANLELAYRIGVRHVEVVTHSNGVVTAQTAFALFNRTFNDSLWNGNDWIGPWNDDVRADVEARRNILVSERTAAGAPRQMEINFYHLQAAASQRWSNSPLDGYGFVSDLLPTAKWVRKSSLGVGYWGWDWMSPNYFTGSLDYILPRFRFYYNGPDWMTYDFYRYSTVGRRESLAWAGDVLGHMLTGPDPHTVHYYCSSGNQSVCGPDHQQGDSMWYFSSPAMPGTGAPMAWGRE